MTKRIYYHPATEAIILVSTENDSTWFENSHGEKISPVGLDIDASIAMLLGEGFQWIGYL